jgi:hypothetical protein
MYSSMAIQDHAVYQLKVHNYIYLQYWTKQFTSYKVQLHQQYWTMQSHLLKMQHHQHCWTIQSYYLRFSFTCSRQHRSLEQTHSSLGLYCLFLTFGTKEEILCIRHTCYALKSFTGWLVNYCLFRHT